MIGRGEHSEIVSFVGRTRRFRAVGQLDRRLPGRRADVEAVPLRGADVGACAPQVGVAARRARQQPRRPGQGRPRAARVAARERSGQRVLDFRQGSLLVRGARIRRAAARADGQATAASGRPSTGRPRSTASRDGLRDIVAKHGGEALGTLASPHSTLEETGACREARARPRQRQHRLPPAPVGLPRRRTGATAFRGSACRSPSSMRSIACSWSAASCAKIIR